MNNPNRNSPKEKLQANFFTQEDKDFKDDKQELEDELSEQSIDSQIVSKNMENLNVIPVVNFVKNGGDNILRDPPESILERSGAEPDKNSNLFLSNNNSHRSFTADGFKSENKDNYKNLVEALFLKQSSNQEIELTPSNKLKDRITQEENKGKLGTKQINLEAQNGTSDPADEDHNKDEEAGLKDGDEIDSGVMRHSRMEHAKTTNDMLKKQSSKLFQRSGLTLESFSEKSHLLWSKLKGSVVAKRAVTRLSNIIARKNLNEKQIELIADLSHGKLDNIRIPRLAILLTKQSRHSNKKPGSGRLKGLLTKHVIKKRDVQNWLKTCKEKTSDFLGSVKWQCVSFVSKPFRPDGPFRIFWDATIIILIIYCLILVPYEISFPTDSSNVIEIIDYIIACCFILDMLITFNTGYYSKGALIQKRRDIAMNYLKLWFWLDLVASFPYEIITNLVFENAGSGSKLVKVVTIFKFMKIIRVIRVLKLNQFMQKLEEYFQFSNSVTGIISLIKLVFMILFIAHFQACLWHLIASNPANQNNWMRDAGIENLSADDQYVASFYWAICTMITVGYGDVTAVTRDERIFSVAVMIVGCAVFAYTMNQIGQIILKIDGGSSQRKQKIMALTRYMNKKKIDKETQARIRKYLEYIIEARRTHDGHDEEINRILQKLSSNLQGELMTQVKGKILKDNSLFRYKFSSKFLALLSTHLLEKTVSPEEIIFKEQEPGNTMYFISRGKVDIYFPACRNVSLKTLERGEYFGEIEFFSEQPRTASAKSITFSNVFILNKEEFLTTMDRFYSDKEFVCLAKDSINLYKDYKPLFTTCYACSTEGHIALECPQLHFICPIQIVIDKYKIDVRKFRRNFIRRPRPKKKNLMKTMLIEAKHITSRYAAMIKSQLAQRTHGSIAEFNVLESEFQDSQEEYPRVEFNKPHKMIRFFPNVFVNGSPEASSKADIGEQSNFQNQLSSEGSMKRQESIKRTNKRFLSVNPTLGSNSLFDRKRSRTNLIEQPIPIENEYKLLLNIHEDPNTLQFGQANPAKTKINEIDLMEQDTVKNYEVYFPHNNICKILDEILKKEKKKNERINIENIKNILPPENMAANAKNDLNKPKSRRNSLSLLDSVLKIKRDQSPLLSRFGPSSQFLKGEKKEKSENEGLAGSAVQINESKSADKLTPSANRKEPPEWT